MAQKNIFAFTRINYILMGIALIVIIMGYILMSGKGSTAEQFNPAIFDTRHTVVAPMVCLAGYLFMVFAILYRPKCTTCQATPQATEASTTDKATGATAAQPTAAPSEQTHS